MNEFVEPPFITIFAFQHMKLKGDYYTCHVLQIVGGFSNIYLKAIQTNIGRALKLYKQQLDLIYCFDIFIVLETNNNASN